MKIYGIPASLAILLLPFFLASCQQEEKTVPVRKNVEEAIFASGYTEQENLYTISAKVDGLLTQLPIKVGDTVALNDLIAVVENEVQNNQLQDAVVIYEDAKKSAASDSPKLQHLQAQIDQAKEQLAFDQENYLRYKGLWEKKSVAQLDFEKVELQYKNAQSNLAALQKNYEETLDALQLNVQRSLVQVNTQQSLLKDYALMAETSGKVINVFKKQGELVRRGETIAEVGSGAYIIKLFVAEDDIVKVNLGQAVAININTYPDQVFEAAVTKIYPGFDDQEQSYLVEAQFKQFPPKMFSGTQLQANIKTGSRKDIVFIPTPYVSKEAYVMLENGEEKQIKIGTKNSVWTEVVSGISVEDVIVKPKS